MIHAMVSGALVKATDEGDVMRGRIAMEGDKPMQIVVKRESLKEKLRQLPKRAHVNVSGVLFTSPRFSGEGLPYVCHTLHVETVQPLEPVQPLEQPKGLIARLMKD